MKTVVGALVIFCMFCTVGRFVWWIIDIPTSPPLIPGEYLLPTKDKAVTVEIDGCSYLLLPGPRLVHKGNCHSPSHLRGGALLEDWSGR